MKAEISHRDKAIICLRLAAISAAWSLSFAGLPHDGWAHGDWAKFGAFLSGWLICWATCPRPTISS